MRISYSLLKSMAAGGDVNAQFVLAKWDHELGYQAAHGKKIECQVSQSGEMRLFVSSHKQTLPHTPAAIIQQNRREAAITQPEMKTPVPPPMGASPTLSGQGSRTPTRPSLRKETWQWMAVQRPDLNTSAAPELPIPEKAKLPFPTTYSGVLLEDE